MAKLVLLREDHEVPQNLDSQTVQFPVAHPASNEIAGIDTDWAGFPIQSVRIFGFPDQCTSTDRSPSYSMM
jgi:hypothetical protein